MKQGGIIKKFDAIVIGGGSAGVSAAVAISNFGKKVCLIESEKLGGECPNWACVPSKALIKSARSYYFAKHEAKDFGVYAQEVTYNYKTIMRHKNRVVGAIVGGGRLENILKSAKIELIKGKAEFKNDKILKVGKQELTASKFVVATGASSFTPPISGLKECGYMTFKDVVTENTPPKSVVVIGGGPVACEFASFYAMLGIKVIIIEMQPTLLGLEDPEISQLAENELKQLGVLVFTKSKVLSVEKRGREKHVVFQQGKKKREGVNVHKILIAAGKKANTQNLGLERAGVALDKFGNIKTNNKLQTNKKHIFAIGDVTGGIRLTSVAHYEGDLVAHNIFGSLNVMRKREVEVVPSTVFLKSEVASVGLNSTQAARLKIKFKVHRFNIGSLARSVAENERAGLLKVLTDKNGIVIGAHMIGPSAGEIIHELALAVKLKVNLSQLTEMIYAFPTYSEAIAGLD